MNRALQVLALMLLITVVGSVHVAAKFLVDYSQLAGLAVLLALFASLPWLKRYLD